MRKLMVAIGLIAMTMPALAQQPAPEVQALDLMLHQAVRREANATAEVMILRGQLAAITKERDELKAKVAPDAPK